MSKIFPMRKEYHNVQLTENGSKEIFHVCKGHRVEGCFDASNMVKPHPAPSPRMAEMGLSLSPCGGVITPPQYFNKVGLRWARTHTPVEII